MLEYITDLEDDLVQCLTIKNVLFFIIKTNSDCLYIDPSTAIYSESIKPLCALHSRFDLSGSLF